MRASAQRCHNDERNGDEGKDSIAKEVHFQGHLATDSGLGKRVPGVSHRRAGSKS
jgi:hypothetical protein